MVEPAVTYWQCMKRSVILASAARLSVHRSRARHGSRAIKGEHRSDSRHRGFSRWHICCPVQSAFTEMRPDKAVLSARPDAFRAASGLNPRLHSSTLADSCPFPVCSNQSPRKSWKLITTHINHSPWILTLIGLPLTPATLA